MSEYTYLIQFPIFNIVYYILHSLQPAMALKAKQNNEILLSVQYL